MTKKILKLFALILTLSCHINKCRTENNTQDVYETFSNTALLSNPEEVRKAFKEHFTTNEITFQEVYFTTEDNVQIHGLLFKKGEGLPTIIGSGGFYPGTAEGNGNIITMMAQAIKENTLQANLLFINTRRHGPSGTPAHANYGIFGWMFKNVRNFGHDCLGYGEWTDIKAAYQYALDKLQASALIGLGVCAGTYHMAKAHKHLQESNHHQDKRILEKIKGYWFDSTWTHPEETTKKIALHEMGPAITKPIAQPFKGLPILYNLIDTAICTPLNWLIAHALLAIHYIIASEDQKKLLNTYLTLLFIKAPIAFAHATDDPSTPFEPIKEIHEKRYQMYGTDASHLVTPEQTTKPIGHTKFSLKQAKRYRVVLISILQKMLAKPEPAQAVILRSKL